MRVPRLNIARGELLLLVGVVALTAVLRMGWPGLTEFKADEARLTLLALEMAEGSRFALRGITSSVGVPNFPMSVWLYALPLAVWPHVYGATLFTGLLNTLAVAGTYWLVRRFWGRQAALVAALMFAVSPWAIHHARKIWAQNLLPFFVVGWGIAALLAFVERRSRWIVPHLLCLAIAVQAHLAAVALAPATAVYLFIYRRRVSGRWLGIGLLLSALTALPFVVYLLTEGRPFLSLGSLSSGGSRTVSAAALRFSALLTGGAEIHALAGPTAFRAYLDTVPDGTAVQWLWLALAAGGLGVLVWQWRRGPARQRDAALVVLLWGLLPLLFYTLPILPVELHYLLPIYPVPYVAAGVLVATLPPAGRRVLAGGVALTAVLQVWLWGALLGFMATTATPGGFGTPLRYQLAAVTAVERQVAQVQADEVLIAGVGDQPLLDNYPAVWDVLLRQVSHRFVDVRDTAVFPDAAAVVLLDPAGPGATLYQQAAEAHLAVPRRPGEGTWQVLSLPPVAAAPQHAFDPPHILANWAAFAGYDEPVLHDDGTATWYIYWFAGERSADDFHLFNHLVDAQGARVAQADADVFSAQQWQSGDLVATVVQLDWPETAVTMHSGMYTFPDLTPVPIFDVAGNPAATAVAIPLRNAE